LSDKNVTNIKLKVHRIYFRTSKLASGLFPNLKIKRVWGKITSNINACTSPIRNHYTNTKKTDKGGIVLIFNSLIMF
jgi:hypothetical protein